MAWHVDELLLAEYQGGRLDPSRVMAVDAHLQACADCRGAVPVDAEWLDRSWEAVLDRLQPPTARGLLSGHRVRLLAATPALRWSWLAATVAVLAFGVVAAHAGDFRSSMSLFLIFAPILPVLAVATAYGPPFDPMHEITSMTPAAGPALVLWRAAAVVAASMAMGMVAAALLPGPGWYAVAWLLPSFLLCVSSLALATVMPLPLAAGVLAAIWATTVGAIASSGTALPMFGPAAQFGYLLAAAVAAGVLTTRRRRLDPGASR